MLTFEPRAGMHVREACEAALQLANNRQAPVWFWFNCIDLTAEPGASIDELLNRYQAEVRLDIPSFTA